MCLVECILILQFFFKSGLNSFGVANQKLFKFAVLKKEEKVLSGKKNKKAAAHLFLLLTRKPQKPALAQQQPSNLAREDQPAPRLSFFSLQTLTRGLHPSVPTGVTLTSSSSSSAPNHARELLR